MAKKHEFLILIRLNIRYIYWFQAKDRAEVSRVDAERTLEQPPAPPEPPDIPSRPPGGIEGDKAHWRNRPEEKRRKLRHSSRSILDFINSELLDNEPAHKTVVFIGDQTVKTVDRLQTSVGIQENEVLRIDTSVDLEPKEVLRIDIPSKNEFESGIYRAIPATASQSVQTCAHRLVRSDRMTQTLNDSESVQVQTDRCPVPEPVSRSVQTDRIGGVESISISVQTKDSIISENERELSSLNPCNLNRVNSSAPSQTEQLQQLAVRQTTLSQYLQSFEADQLPKTVISFSF